MAKQLIKKQPEKIETAAAEIQSKMEILKNENPTLTLGQLRILAIREIAKNK